MLGIGFVAVLLCLGLLLVAVSYFLREPNALEQLGVKSTYSHCALPSAKIEAYEELKEKLRTQYGGRSDENGDDRWMSMLPLEAKDMVKYRLMQRAIGDMAVLQKIDVDARGYWRLFSKGMVTKQFWDSVVRAERNLSMELEAVKREASFVEPTQDPQGIISEAMQFIMRYGDKLPAAADVASSADAINDLMKHLPQPGQGGVPPGMPHPGMLPPPGMGHPGLHPGMRPPPPPGVQAPQEGNGPGSGDTNAGFNWRQDPEEIEVSVSLPATATKADVKVVFKSRSLRVEHRGEVLVEGQLASGCHPEESTWTMSKGRVVVSLQKADSRPWQTLFVPAKA